MKKDSITIHHGDCREILSSLEQVDAVVTDPPYGLNFMGKDWDHGVPGEWFWRRILAVMKPGAHLLAFGGTRTHHRLMVAIEDAGFEIRDCLMWVYGTGFPKSLDVGKAIDKAAGVERKVVGKYRVTGTAATDGRQGRASIAAEAKSSTGQARELKRTAPATDAAKQWEGWGTALKPAWEPIVLARRPLEGTVAKNVMKHGTGGINVDGCRIEGPPGTGHWTHKRDIGDGNIYGKGGRTDEDFGKVNPHGGRWPANLIHDGSDEVTGLFPESKNGGAARFFYCAKANKAERGEGNDHPIVKPLALMRYLCRIVTPPGGTVLDPFMGSGSTLLAARAEGFKAVGIEIEEHSCEIATRRLREASS